VADKHGDFTPVVKVDVRGADPSELVARDPRLARSGFVRALGEDSASVLKLGLARRYTDTVVLFQQGDAGNSLFFVLRGELRLFARKEHDVVEIGTAGPGDFVGEAEFLAGAGVRACTAIAKGEVDAVELARRVVLRSGELSGALKQLLDEVSASRAKKLDEMTDFLNTF